MLTRETIFRNIDADRVELIQQHIAVDYDNNLQMPIGFFYAGLQLEVIELLGAFRESRNDPSVLYLVRTQHGVYALYPDLIPLQSPKFWRGRWVLHFRVEEEQEEKTMLVDFKLKQSVDFHGHLCSDLAIGYRVSLYALQKLALELLAPTSLRIIIENNTSAVDAVQRLTGCTLGNARLQVHDYGKHVYTFLYQDACALQVAIKSDAIPNNPEFLALEARLQNQQASMQETARYQILLDELVTHWLKTPFDTLFESQHTTALWPEKPVTSAMVLCDRCHQPVVKTHLVIQNGERLCQVCQVMTERLEKYTE